MRKAILALALGLSLGGCLYQNMSPATKLRDSIEQGNEGARWGRMDIAMERVAPEYAREYALRHQEWGDSIQMADLDILRVAMAEDEDSATVTVAFSWYSYDDMTMQRTVVQQKWKSVTGGYFVMFEEEVIDGSEDLLALPEGAEEELAGDEDDDEAVAAGTSGGENEGAGQASDSDSDSDEEGWVEGEGEEAAEDEDAAGALARADEPDPAT